MEEQKKVAIYIRVSTLDQAREGYSLEAREKTLRKWCTDRKLFIYDLYADRGISGKDIEHRPDMNRLLRDAKENKFDMVIFWALSRFTRSVSDLYTTLEKFQKWANEERTCQIGFDDILNYINPDEKMENDLMNCDNINEQIDKYIIEAMGKYLQAIHDNVMRRLKDPKDDCWNDNY